MAVKKSKVSVATDAQASSRVAATKKTVPAKPAATAAPGAAAPPTRARKATPAATEPTPAPAKVKAKKAAPVASDAVAPVKAKAKAKKAAPVAAPAEVSAPPEVKTRKATPAVSTVTGSKAATPKPSPTLGLAPSVAPRPAPAAARKASSPLKLTGRQVSFLKQIQDAKELGYLLARKAEQKTIDALMDRKLIKKGAKDKTSGHYRYIVSKAGEKHLSSLPASP